MTAATPECDRDCYGFAHYAYKDMEKAAQRRTVYWMFVLANKPYVWTDSEKSFERERDFLLGHWRNGEWLEGRFERRLGEKEEPEMYFVPSGTNLGRFRMGWHEMKKDRKRCKTLCSSD